MRVSLLALTSASLLSLRDVSAFLPSSKPFLFRKKVLSIGAAFFDDDSSAFDVEAARQKFESLLIGSNSEGSNNNGNSFPPRPSFEPPTLVRRFSPSSFEVLLPAAALSKPPPMLTSIDRSRRLAEMNLLAQLDSGDDALSELWSLWFQERGPVAAKRLLEAEELTGQGPHSWDSAERILLELVEEYGVYWAEPLNRLATLYFMQGRLDQAEALCQMVLAIKPWHFGALSGIVMVYAGLKDVQSARVWAARRLPTFAPTGSNRRRLAWVEQAVRDAEQALLDAERRVRTAFGSPDEHARRRRRHEQKVGDNFEDAWQ